MRSVAAHQHYPLDDQGLQAAVDELYPSCAEILVDVVADFEAAWGRPVTKKERGEEFIWPTVRLQRQLSPTDCKQVLSSLLLERNKKAIRSPGAILTYRGRRQCSTQAKS